MPDEKKMVANVLYVPLKYSVPFIVTVSLCLHEKVSTDSSV